MAHKLKLHGLVGAWWDRLDSGTVTDEIDALKPEDGIDVYINSPGGSATQGVAIYNALKAHAGTVRVFVDALAASSASIIAMAGDEIVMREGALMMIHNPWSITAGDAAAHRKNADILDKHRDALAGVYMAATGKSAEDINAIMDDETWLTAKEAVDEGFATSVAKAAPDDAQDVAASLVAFASDLQKFTRVPDRLRAEVAAAMREHPQSKPHRAKAQGEEPMEKEEQKKIEEAQAQARAADLEAAAAKAVEAERTRAAAIRKACASVNAPGGLADTLISEGVSAEAAGLRIIDALAAAQPTTPINATASITGGKDAGEKFVEGATQAIMSRMGKAPRDPRNEFNGMSLVELARVSASRNGVDVRGMNKLAMVGTVFAANGGHSTSDFPLILENITRKMIREGYENAPETFRQWTSKGSAPDFRPFSSVSLGSFSELSEVIEGAEFTHGTIGESGESAKLATFGKLITITRQAIINDSLDLFSRIPIKMGESWTRTIASVVAAVLTENNDLSDGVALFHATHNNALSNNDLDFDGLKAAMIAMSSQTDDAGNPLDIEPQFIIVANLGDELLANDLVGNQYLPGDAGLQKNPFFGRFKVVRDNRLDDAYWYLAGSPSDTIQVSYLDGVEAPYLEQQQGWTIDGTTYKVRGDVGAHALDHRSLVRSEFT